MICRSTCGKVYTSLLSFDRRVLSYLLLAIRSAVDVAMHAVINSLRTALNHGSQPGTSSCGFGRVSFAVLGAWLAMVPEFPISLKRSVMLTSSSSVSTSLRRRSMSSVGAVEHCEHGMRPARQLQHGSCHRRTRTRRRRFVCSWSAGQESMFSCHFRRCSGARSKSRRRRSSPRLRRHLRRRPRPTWTRCSGRSSRRRLSVRRLRF